MKRDPSDKNWQKVKKEVKLRDGNICRLAKVLSIPEYLQLCKSAGSLLSQLDSAHYLSVSDRPDLTYESNNIVMLNRYSHSLLDDFKDPITGKAISFEKHNEWWNRILSGNKSQYLWLKENNLLGEN